MLLGAQAVTYTLKGMLQTLSLFSVGRFCDLIQLLHCIAVIFTKLQL